MIFNGLYNITFYSIARYLLKTDVGVRYF